MLEELTTTTKTKNFFGQNRSFLTCDFKKGLRQKIPSRFNPVLITPTFSDYFIINEIDKYFRMMIDKQSFQLGAFLVEVLFPLERTPYESTCYTSAVVTSHFISKV